MTSTSVTAKACGARCARARTPVNPLRCRRRCKLRTRCRRRLPREPGSLAVEGLRPTLLQPVRGRVVCAREAMH